MFGWLRKFLRFLFIGKGPHMPTAPGTPVICDVFALGNGQFRHEWRFQGGANQGNGRIEVPEKKAGEPGTPIQFHLHPNGTGLQFDTGNDPNGISKSIWVQQNGCPTAPSKDAEITVDQMSPNLLKVTDANLTECELHYNLRFTPDPDTNCYDPEIKNGGTK